MQGESQFILVFVVSSLIIALILILVILFVLAYQKRLVTQKIHLEKIEREHQLQLLKATLEVQERERRRIASDLHDDIGSLLSALKLNVQFLEDAETNEKQRSFLAKTREKLETGIEQVRRISHDIYPPTLHKLGLWESLADFFRSIEESNSVHVVFNPGYQNERPDPKTELAVFRVIQELTTNSLRHSGASELRIWAEQQGANFIIHYHDNGKGISEDRLQQGLGMLNMKSRLEAIHGSIEFASQPNQGSSAKIEFTLNTHP